MKQAVWIFAAFGLLANAEEKKPKEESSKKDAVVTGHVFAWGFLEPGKMQPQGGMTKGAEVTLDTAVPEQWKKLQAAEGDFEKDRQAILAMAGDYRVSFDFVETLGLREGYQPPNPYFSWGTEHVEVIIDEKELISLQHTLVMFFKDEDGKESGPFLVKHWRQDWRYQDTDLHTYQGHLTWKRETRTADEVTGKWTQAVFQVDDSPRYEVVGQWSHQGGMSMWKSEAGGRPLPRREFSIRDDYNVLDGTHEITIVPTGWVHVQNNQKLSVSKDGTRKYVGQELGVNRYERITKPSLAAAGESWAKTGAYWAEVRNVWAEVFAKNDSFTLKPEVDGKKLYQEHFAFAGEVEKSGYDEAKAKEHAKSTVTKFLAQKKGAKDGKY